MKHVLVRNEIPVIAIKHNPSGKSIDFELSPSDNVVGMITMFTPRFHIDLSMGNQVPVMEISLTCMSMPCMHPSQGTSSNDLITEILYLDLQNFTSCCKQ